MKKLRWTFAIVAAISAALFAFLLFSVHRAIENERSARHRAVAERVFDEMERSLTEILQRDDERSQVGERATHEAAALGYFELYGDRSLPAMYGGRRSFASTPSVDVIAARVIGAPLHEEAFGQEPGSTISISGLGTAEEVPAYRAIAALNRASQLRRRHDGLFDFGAYEVRTSDEHVVVSRSLSRRVSRVSYREYPRFYEVGHTEGVVLDHRALRDWLAEQTFRSASFEVSRFELTTAGAPASSRNEPFVYRHRFAEPFDDLAATISIVPIADASSGLSVYLLAALLAIAVILGLFAAYRMTVARVRFAERQDQFVSAVTHELRTPLTTLRMYSEMLRDGIVPPDAEREYYDAMVSESQRLGRLVDNVLQQAKLAKRAKVERAQPAEIKPLIEHAVAIAEPHARAHGFELTSSIEEGLPPALVDRDAITQIVLNLVDNAIAHSGESAAKRAIELRCERREDGVVLSVRDHGRGVPEELIEDVFEPFVHGSSRGVGLGLALVRALVLEMGGIVYAENAAGGGFRVTALLRAA